ncbi:MAG: flavodoxin, partial [Oscillospiraceae bacterium]|nr:flavodoxin [Oscillospiraceae bacterium]
RENIGKIVCFGTSAMMKSMKRPVRKVAEGFGIPVADEEFHCRGQFGKMHRGRPNDDDLEALSAFVQKIIEE